jgi:hypothetical protein
MHYQQEGNATKPSLSWDEGRNKTEKNMHACSKGSNKEFVREVT